MFLSTLAGAVILLFISSSVSMSVPYFMGNIIDTISSDAARNGQAMETLTRTCYILSGVFLIGGLANFGRVYLIHSSGTISHFTCIVIKTISA